MKYVYCILLGGGFNDQLCTIKLALDYCDKSGRTLIINNRLFTYDVDFEMYFNFPLTNIIYDVTMVKKLVKDNSCTIYQEIDKKKICDSIDNKYTFGLIRPYLTCDNIILSLPNSNVNEDLIVFGRRDGGDGYPLFKNLIFKPKIKQIISDRYKTLKKPYLCIQIRNTDYKCDYELLYENNKTEINSSNEIYIATDDKKALKFFIDKGLPVKNFTTFPIASEYRSLHMSQLDPHIKFIDMLSDIYICGMSDNLISSSIGGFIRLIRNCNQNKYNLNKQFELLDNK